MAGKQLYLEYGGDFIVTPNGGLQTATGWDAIRQNLERVLFTNAQAVLDSGRRVEPDWIFHPNFGLGLRVLVGQNMTQPVINTLIQKIKQAVAANPDIAINPAPIITVQPIPDSHEVVIFINVFLSDQTPGSLAVALSPSP